MQTQPASELASDSAITQSEISSQQIAERFAETKRKNDFDMV